MKGRADERPRSEPSQGSSPRRQRGQHHYQQQGNSYDDSFSEAERFGTTTFGTSSWEATSFDSDRPASVGAVSRFERRNKRFDSTTPTLVDEDDEEEMLISLEQQQQYGYEAGASKQDESIRRTPGASMFEVRRPPSTDEAATTISSAGSLGYALTLSTPVASGEEHQQPSPTSLKGATSSLSSTGGGATLSGAGGVKQSASAGAWEYAAAATATTATSITTSSSFQQGSPTSEGVNSELRPPLARSARPQPEPSASPRSSGNSAFSFQPWATTTPSASSATADEQQHHLIQRQGAFSPGLLRLTEDIGNLLQEDEDDDYTIEIPSVFRSEDDETEFGTTSGTSTSSTTDNNPHINWAGSFAVERNSRFARKTMNRAVGAPGRSRRRNTSTTSAASSSASNFVVGEGAFSASTQQQQAGPFFPHAQQPKPRRSGNEIFEFGKASNEPQRASPSPQLLNFGGAFAPLGKDSYAGGSVGGPDSSSSGGFTRPVAYAPSSLGARGEAGPPPTFTSSFQPPHMMMMTTDAAAAGPPLSSSFQPPRQQPTQQQQQQQRIDYGEVPGQHHPMQQQQQLLTNSFDSYSSGNAAAARGASTAYFQPYRFASPSPTAMMSFSTAYHHQSDMQATALEFVPMGRSTTPLMPLIPQHQQLQPQSQSLPWQQPPPASPFDATSSLDHQSSWHSTPSYGINYGFLQPQQQQQQQFSSLGDARTATTPSPHLSAWHQQPGDSISSSSYGGSAVLHSSSSRVEGMNPAFVVPVASVPAATTTATVSQSGTASADQSQQGVKKESKRGKRAKKKTPQISTANSSNTKSEATTTPGKKTAAGKKKKQSGNEGRPESTTTTQSHDGQGEDAVVSTSDDPIDYRRAELDESPTTRLAFKEFYKAYRSEEQFGVQKAEEFAMQALQDGTLPESIHWRVYIELADLARRSNRFVDARRLYQKVCQLQPYASQGWVEYSKLEEECGHMNRVTNILHAGLEYCEYNENLLIRAVKHQERMGNFGRARVLLARLKHVGVDKVWRTILEGALFEARAGNIVLARRVLKYIMHHVPWYGPLYVEFYRLERDHGHPLDALDVVERGLSQIPRYGPLWFSSLRICEELDFSEKHFHLPKTTAMLQRASANVSKEIAWKVHLEASFIFERAAQEQSLQNNGPVDPFLSPARHFFSLTIRTCRLNLRWKVWLAAARMELCAGNTDTARTLFLRAHQVAPEKVRSLTFLDFARLSEFVGDAELARAILCKGRYDYGHDWKVWLESVLLEMRGFNLRRAFELASRALDVHHGTGRLWAAKVQLSQYIGGDEAQYTALRSALNAVPKSGEVWCEGARIHLNPFSDLFDLDRARRHLFFAGKFTPQYGDSFLEAVRLELLDQWLAPIADYIWEQTASSFSPSGKRNEFDCLTKYITDVSLAIYVASSEPGSESEKNTPALVHQQIVATVRQLLKRENFEDKIDLSATVLSCANVDPNYGPLWFNCRRVQTDPPRRVVEHAAESMVKDLQQYARVYLAAMVRRKAILSTIPESEKPPVVDNNDLEIFDALVMDWEERVDKLLRKFPSLGDIYNPMDPTTGLVLLESTLGGSDFVTGLMEFNKRRPIDQMSLSDRKRAIFATDALFP